MIIGVPKEIKNHEYRVGMTPASVKEIISSGHSVYIETKAGLGIGFDDEAYLEAGAKILNSAAEIFEKSDMIVKVKEPQQNERAMLKEGQILFTYLHLAPDPIQTQDLLKSKAICIAYETVTDPFNRLPLLAPMSEVAGRMAIQAGAQALEKSKGGQGLLLSGVPGVMPAKVVILGGGVVGSNAARMAIGLRADVTILDKNIETLRHLDEEFQGKAKLIYSTKDEVDKAIIDADLIIGAVLIPGAAAPKIITKEHLQKMKIGAAMVDVAIDQGGCFETSKPTTHDKPTYIIDNIVHYCVANMPGAVARTSTFALNNATLPYILNIANKGYQQALMDDPNLCNGLNVCFGHITYQPVANALNLAFMPAQEALKGPLL